MNLVAIIPARGGSKTIPGKNLLQINTRSLLERAIKCAQQSAEIDRIIVSTDSDEIAENATNLKVEVPFLRPSRLALDNSSDFPVFQHVIRWLQDNENYEVDCVVWLRPTSPLRSTQDVDGAIRILEETGADSVRSISKVAKHPYWMKVVDKSYRLSPVVSGVDEKEFYRRQLLPEVYCLNGAVEVIKVNAALKHNSLYGEDIRGYIMPPNRGVDIDTYEDVLYAEFLENISAV